MQTPNLSFLNDTQEKIQIKLNIPQTEKIQQNGLLRNDNIKNFVDNNLKYMKQSQQSIKDRKSLLNTLNSHQNSPRNVKNNESVQVQRNKGFEQSLNSFDSGSDEEDQAINEQYNKQILNNQNLDDDQDIVEEENQNFQHNQSSRSNKSSFNNCKYNRQKLQNQLQEDNLTNTNETEADIQKINKDKQSIFVTPYKKIPMTQNKNKMNNNNIQINNSNNIQKQNFNTINKKKSNGKINVHHKENVGPQSPEPNNEKGNDNQECDKVVQNVKQRKTNQQSGHVLFSHKTNNADFINFSMNASNKGLQDLQSLEINQNVLQLHSIDLSLNKFTNIPIELYKFKNLKILKLDNNFLKSIPPALFTELRLENFSLMNNLLRQIPEQILFLQNSLISLNIAKNHLQSLTKSIFQMKKIKVLIISSNDYDTISNEFINLRPTLKELVIDWFKYCQPSKNEIAKGEQLEQIFDIIEDLNGADLTIPYFLHKMSHNQFFDRTQIYWNNKQRNQMHQSIISEDISMLRFLIDQNKELAEQLDFEGHSPLSLAIREEKYFCAKILIFAKCDVNIGGGPLGSCLSLGIVKQQFFLVRDLLKFGANPNQKDGEGNTALHYLFAIFNKDVQEAKQIGQLLLNYKANPNTVNKDGNAPIHIAAKKGSTAAIQFILDYNKNVVNDIENEQDENDLIFQIDKVGGEEKHSILQIAAFNGFVELVSLLLQECPQTFSKSMAVNLQINMTQKNNTISKLMKIAEKKFINHHVLGLPDIHSKKYNQNQSIIQKQTILINGQVIGSDIKQQQQPFLNENDLTTSQKLRKRPITPVKPNYFHMQKQPSDMEKTEVQINDNFEDEDDDLDNEDANVIEEENEEEKPGLVNETFNLNPSQNNQLQQQKQNQIMQKQILKHKIKNGQTPINTGRTHRRNNTQSFYEELQSNYIIQQNPNQSFEDFDEDDFLEETEWLITQSKFMPYISEVEVGSCGITSTQNFNNLRQSRISLTQIQEHIDRKVKNIINNCYHISDIRKRILCKNILPIKLSCVHTLFNLHFQILDFLSNITKTPHSQLFNLDIHKIVAQPEYESDWKLVFLLNNAIQIIETCKELYEVISSQQKNKFKAGSYYSEITNFNINETVDCQVLQYVIASRYPSQIVYQSGDNILAQYSVFQDICQHPQQLKNNQKVLNHKFLITDSGFEKFFPHEDEQSQLDDSINIYKIEKSRKNPLLTLKYT